MPALVTAFLLIGSLLLLAAALHDVMARTVPNGLAGALAAVGLGAQLAGGTALLGVPVALAVFVAAALAWRRGLMGGGDVKLLGAAALLVPPMLVPTLLVAMALSGGVLGLFYLVARRRMPRPSGARPPGLLPRAWRIERWRLRRGGPLPYAVAIASGAFFALSHGGLP